MTQSTLHIAKVSPPSVDTILMTAAPVLSPNSGGRPAMRGLPVPSLTVGDRALAARMPHWASITHPSSEPAANAPVGSPSARLRVVPARQVRTDVVSAISEGPAAPSDADYVLALLRNAGGFE